MFYRLHGLQRGRSQVTTLLAEGAKVLCFWGQGTSKAARIADKIVAELGDEIAVESIENDHPVDFLWQFRLVHAPPASFYSAQYHQLIAIFEIEQQARWLAAIHEIYLV